MGNLFRWWCWLHLLSLSSFLIPLEYPPLDHDCEGKSITLTISGKAWSCSWQSSFLARKPDLHPNQPTTFFWLQVSDYWLCQWHARRCLLDKMASFPVLEKSREDTLCKQLCMVMRPSTAATILWQDWDEINIKRIKMPRISQPIRPRSG